MEITIRKKCPDCPNVFDDPHDLHRICEMCRDRAQSYRERAIQDSMPEEDDHDAA